MRPGRPPKITDHDRLGMTFFLAAVFHGIMILGITFSLTEETENKTAPTLDIILVQTQNPSETDDADYLAQVSQKGGGDGDEKSRPRDTFTAPTLAEDPGQALKMTQQQISTKQQLEEIKMLHQSESDYSIETNEQQVKPDKKTVLKKENTNKNINTAQLAKEISTIIENQARKTKVKYMNSSTREFTPARYMREWINRVERVGNLNYPDRARREKLSGTLILDVVINSDGELMEIELRQSSGHQVLDDAAKRIVKLAAPYSPFPEILKREADVIHITRSWEFMSDSKLKSR